MNKFRASESLRKMGNVRQIESKDERTYKVIRASRCAAVQGKSHDSSGKQREKCSEKLQNAKYSGKAGLFVDLAIEQISSVQSSQLLLQVSAWKIYTGRSELPTSVIAISDGYFVVTFYIKIIKVPRRDKLIFIRHLKKKSSDLKP